MWILWFFWIVIWSWRPEIIIRNLIVTMFLSVSYCCSFRVSSFIMNLHDIRFSSKIYGAHDVCFIGTPFSTLAGQIKNWHTLSTLARWHVYWHVKARSYHAFSKLARGHVGMWARRPRWHVWPHGMQFSKLS